jgi:iron only hydrogenase large subunit-like protein
MEKLRPVLKKYQKRGQCIPEETIKKISTQINIPVHQIYKRVCYHSPVKEDHYQIVKKLLEEKKKHLIVETAPSTRVSLGEEFGLEPGTNVMGKMVSSL